MIGPQAQPAAGRNRGWGGGGGGYSLSELYLLTNPARFNLPETKVPADIALKVTEPHKLHHHVKVITHGEVVVQILARFCSH